MILVLCCKKWTWVTNTQLGGGSLAIIFRKLFGVAKSNILSPFTTKCPFVCHFHFRRKKFDAGRGPLFWVAVARFLR